MSEREQVVQFLAISGIVMDVYTVAAIAYVGSGILVLASMFSNMSGGSWHSNVPYGIAFLNANFVTWQNDNIITQWGRCVIHTAPIYLRTASLQK